jgi:hypothetical protein
MANDTHSDTAAILGELESLKALLRTLNADGIPLLQETVTVPATATPVPPLLSDGIPVLTQVEPITPAGASRYTDPDLEAARRALNEVYSNYSQALATAPAPATATGEIQLDIFQAPAVPPATPLPTVEPPARSTPVSLPASPITESPLSVSLLPEPPLTESPSPVSPPSPAVPAAGTARPADPQAVKARGENPFLPKHIRDRLHTHKALVDIINESKANLPPTGFATPDPVKQLIEQVIADYMPHIETELRLRLQQLAREGKLQHKPQD